MGLCIENYREFQANPFPALKEGRRQMRSRNNKIHESDLTEVAGRTRPSRYEYTFPNIISQVLPSLTPG